MSLSLPLGVWRLLPMEIALLDPDWTIAAATDAWLTSASVPGERLPDYGIGKSFVNQCRDPQGESGAHASAVHAAVTRVMLGQAESERVEFPADGKERQLTATRVTSDAGWQVALVRQTAVSPSALTAEAVAPLDADKPSRQDLEFDVVRLLDVERIAGVGDWALDLQTQRLTWSAETYRIFGLDSVKGKPTYQDFLSCVHSADRTRFERAQALALAGRARLDLVHRIVRPDGAIRYVHERGELVRDERETEVAFRGTVHDVTSIRAAEYRDRSTAEVLLAARGVTGIGSWELDHDTNWLSWSEEACALYGIPFDTFDGDPATQRSLIVPEDRAGFEAVHEGAQASGEPFEHEYRIRRADNQTRWLLERGQRTAGGDRGAQARSSGVVLDITARKRVELSRRWELQVLESISAGLLLHDVLGQVAAGLEGAIEHGMASLRLVDAVGRPSRTVVAPSLPADCVDALDGVLDAASAGGGGADAPVAPGVPIFVANIAQERMLGHVLGHLRDKAACRGISAYWAVPIREAGGTVRGTLAIYHRQERLPDDEERDLIERAARLAAIAIDRDRREGDLRLLETCIGRLNDIVLITEAEPTSHPGPRILYVNEAFERRTGYTRAEVLGKSPRFLQGEKTQRDALDRIRTALTRWEPVREELINYTKAGEEFWLELDIVPVSDATGWFTHWIAVERDITKRKQADARIVSSEARFRELFEQSAVGMCLVGQDGRFRRVNARFSEIVGRTSEALSSLTVQQITRAADVVSTTERLAQIGSGAIRSASWEKGYLREDGSVVWCNVSVVSLPAPDGELPEFAVVVEDISRRRAALEAVASNDQLLRIAGAVAQLGAWSVELPSRAVTWTEMTCRIHGVPVGTAPTYEQSFASLVPESRTLFRDLLERCAEEGTSFDAELELVPTAHRAGSVRIAGQAERNEAGAILRVRGAIQDISDRKQAEREMARVNRALQMISSCAEAVGREISEEALLERVCEIAVVVCGYRMAWVGYAQDDAAQSIRPMAFNGPAAGYLDALTRSWNPDIPAGRFPDGRVIREGVPVECADIQADPNFRRWQVAEQRGFRAVLCLPLRAEGRTFGLLGLYSGAVNAVGPEELRLLTEMADNLAGGIIGLRARLEQGRVHSAVSKMARAISAGAGTEFFDQLALSLAEVLSADAVFVVRIDANEQQATTLSGVVGRKITRTRAIVLRDTPSAHLLEHDSWVESRDVRSAYPMDPLLAAVGAEGFVGTRLAAPDGQVIGALFALFTRSVPESDFILSTMRIFGTRLEGELERTRSEAQVRSQAALIGMARDAIVVRDLGGRITFWNKSAERMFGWSADEAIGRLANDLLQPATERINEVFTVLHATGEWMGELVKVNKAGAKVVVEARWSFVRDARGEPEAVLSFETDVTDRKQLERQYLRAQRMESIGTLAGGIAHDLNNVLSPILLAVDMLRMEFSGGEDSEILSVIETSALRGADMVRQVLSFARGVEGEKVLVQVAPLLREVAKIAGETFPKDIRVRIEAGSDLQPVSGDPTQLHQVILNLCVNARDAMPDGGILTLSARSVDLDAQYVAMHIESQVGPYVLVSVDDTGTGMSAETVERIFEPFFTTKDIGVGTGLGLSTSLAIIKGHGGFTRVDSVIGRGTRFEVYLPTQREFVPALHTLEPAGLTPGQGELVLVVDDEPSLRQITRLTLENFGYRVLLASDGIEALAEYARHQEQIAIVLTDMMMPNMDGVALIRILHDMNPNVRIIAVSGLGAGRGAGGWDTTNVKQFLQKPYTAERLLSVIAETLRRGAVV